MALRRHDQIRTKGPQRAGTSLDGTPEHSPVAAALVLPWRPSRARCRSPTSSHPTRGAALSRPSKGWGTRQTRRPGCCGRPQPRSSRWFRISPIHSLPRSSAARAGCAPSPLRGAAGGHAIQPRPRAGLRDFLSTRQADGLITLMPHVPKVSFGSTADRECVRVRRTSPSRASTSTMSLRVAKPSATCSRLVTGTSRSSPADVEPDLHRSRSWI
jgi:hypothetical protein